MNVEHFLESQLRKFSLIDIAFVKMVYLMVGLLVSALYLPMAALSGWFYFILVVICAFPLEVHLFSQEGSLLEKSHAYLKSNNPSNQVLLFLTQFFFAQLLAKLFPVLASFSAWIYLIVIIPLMIKPLTKTWFW